MFQRVLKKFREKIKARHFVVTLHAVEELEDEGFSVLDIEHAILTGGIATRQKDADTREWKYLIKGRSLSDDEIVVVGKLSPTGKLVIITIYDETES